MYSFCDITTFNMHCIMYFHMYLSNFGCIWNTGDCALCYLLPPLIIVLLRLSELEDQGHLTSCIYYLKHLELLPGLILNPLCPSVYSPRFNLFSHWGDVVISGLCSVRKVLQMGNNELLTSIKWNLSKRLWQPDIVGEFTLVLNFYLKQTAGISDYVVGEGFLICLLISHRSV